MKLSFVSSKVAPECSFFLWRTVGELEMKMSDASLCQWKTVIEVPVIAIEVC